MFIWLCLLLISDFCSWCYIGNCLVLISYEGWQLSSDEDKWDKIINDPLGQPTVSTDIEYLFCFGQFWKVGTYGRTYRHTDGRTDVCDNMCEYNDHYLPGLWSAPWINIEAFALINIKVEDQIWYHLSGAKVARRCNPRRQIMSHVCACPVP